MEFVEVVKELIANLGFPICCVIIMFRELAKEREAHKAESEAWVNAVNNNTLVMEKVLDKLGCE